MFRTEDAMQREIHNRPELILAGIPEINPEFCPDAPGLVSLGREIPLPSGSVDNLFIDINAVLTFVECKRYSDSRLKREVYPQALNYASDLQSQLIHYNGEHFQRSFGQLISGAQSTTYGGIEEVMDALSKDPILEGKNSAEWRRQFLERLEHNIKSGVCRVVLLCAPAPDNAFNYRAVRNLMQLMSFSEHSSLRYDLALMDLREENDNLVSKLIWRRYSALPQIPLVAESSRDTSAGIDAMRERESALPPDRKALLYELLEILSEDGLMAEENIGGYALKSVDSKKSIYTKIAIRDQTWTVIRHQIRSPESIYAKLEADEGLDVLDGLEVAIRCKSSTLRTGKLYEIEIFPDTSTDVHDLAKAIIKIGH